MVTGGQVTRFAPSPNGELHLGHARSALIGFEIARATGGQFLLRIEDIDVGRSRAAFIDGIDRDLAWLGITWEQPVLRQSHAFADYADVIRRLQNMGVLYPCLASRGEILAAATPGAVDPDGAPLYPGLAKAMPQGELAARIEAGEPHALRIDMAAAVALAGRMTDGQALSFEEIDADGRKAVVQARPEIWGDAVIVRKDAPASYHLACVVDDPRQGITMVTRGTDLAAATHLHRLLQTLLGLPPPLYHHHALLLDSDGRKLSKSLQSTALRHLREAGASPAQVRAMAMAGLDPRRLIDALTQAALRQRSGQIG